MTILKKLEPYWTNRFKEEGRIWGITPSNTAYHATGILQASGVNKILVPGSGYGRHAELFSPGGFDVTSIEISTEACSIVKTCSPKTRALNGSVLDIGFENKIFDAIYCFNVLHLFREKERERFIEKCHHELKLNGICYFVVFSEEEETYGTGQEVEKTLLKVNRAGPCITFPLITCSSISRNLK